MAGKIGRCLHSVVDQLAEDMEVLVVDDGSTDDTYKVVSEYASNNSRIHIIQHQNAGVSSARNAGINASKGDYLLFIDADDEIEDGYLQNISNQAKSSGADLLIWGIKRCYPDGSTTEWKPQRFGMSTRTEFLNAFPSEQYGNHEGLYGFVPNKLVKKKLVDRFGIRFNTALTIMEDYDFFLDCYVHSSTILCFGETGYRYQIYNKFNISSDNRVVSYPPLIGVQNKCVDILRQEGAWTDKNKSLLFDAIGRLSLSMFLETSTPVKTRVKSNMDYIWESPYCIPAIEAMDTRWKILKHLILARNVTGACFFLIIWRSYLFIRKANASW